MTSELDTDISALSTAEEFLDYFEIDYDTKLIQTKRIQLLRLFHSVLNTGTDTLVYADYKRALKIAYRQLENGNELAFEAGKCAGCTECDD